MLSRLLRSHRIRCQLLTQQGWSYSDSSDGEMNDSDSSDGEMNDSDSSDGEMNDSDSSDGEMNDIRQA